MISANQLHFDPDACLFPLTVGAVAAGAVHSTYRMYANARRAPLKGSIAGADGRNRDFVLGSASSKKGTSTLLTFRGVLTYAAATPLIRSGMPVARAQEVALSWTCHDERMESSDIGPPPPAPGALYPEPYLTLLCHVNDAYWIAPARSLHDGVELPFSLRMDPPAAMTIVNLSMVHDRCRVTCEEYLANTRSRT